MTNELGNPPATTEASDFAIGLARDVVVLLAPEENEIFGEVASAWREGVAAGKAPGSSVGFGIEAALVSEIVLQVIAGSIVEVMAVGIVAARSRWRGWRERRRGGIAADQMAVKLPTVDGKIVMTAAQAEKLREVSRGHAVALGLTEPRADLLAQAVVGAVYILDPPPPHHDAD